MEVVMKNTLLQEFIIEKAKNYLEPQRKGTPKGDPIGFSKEKFLCSLYMLYNTPQKEIAQMLKISYGLVRKWNTEKAIKDTILIHCFEFADYLFKYLRDKTNSDLQQHKILMQKSLDEIVNYVRPHWDFNEFRDYKNYSPQLDYTLLSSFQRWAKETKNDISFASTLYSVMGAFRHFGEIKKPEEEKRNDKNLPNMFEKYMLQKVIDILLKKTITKNDIKEAVSALSILRQTKE